MLLAFRQKSPAKNEIMIKRRDDADGARCADPKQTPIKPLVGQGRAVPNSGEALSAFERLRLRIVAKEAAARPASHHSVANTKLQPLLGLLSGLGGLGDLLGLGARNGLLISVGSAPGAGSAGSSHHDDCHKSQVSEG